MTGNETREMQEVFCYASDKKITMPVLCPHGWAYVWKAGVLAFGTNGCKNHCIVTPDGKER